MIFQNLWTFEHCNPFKCSPGSRSLGQPHIYVASTPQYLELIAVLDYS